MAQVQSPIRYDVVIVGAGPVGLCLACELRLADLSVLVLEQAADPGSDLKRLPFGLRGLTVPTIEALARRGLLDAVAAGTTAGAQQPAAIARDRRPAGHFAGIQFFHDKIDAARWSYRLPHQASSGMAVSLEHLETVLAARADSLGVEVRRGCAVTALQASDEGVAVQAGGETVHGDWLVGCDGGRSMVRKAGGFAFAGTDPEFTGYSAQVELAEPDSLPQGRHYTPEGMYSFARPGTVALVDFDGGAFHRTHPVTRDHVQAVLRRISGTDVTLEALRLATTWTDRACQATSYRNGRVLLAGDAAHIHSPLGGQGLNLGLGDAFNLGWKLAATIRGKAPADLLDSYERERHPVGAAVLDWSRAQVALMRPARSSRALEAILRDLIDTQDGATYFAERVGAISLRYDLGAGHPLAGRGVPDFALSDGATVADHLAQGRGLFLDFDAAAPYRAVAQRWADTVDCVACEAENTLGLKAALVRPDGIVAWAGTAPADHEAAAGALARWFGAPSPS
ncbi:FAD-dependent monooxygenase [Lichenihabitans sp. Uapishka_5]|uniref:FAD-dependent monooxygenase n=1 Tax=Lichenihabitans sp. Uapishka_5 TaxID=3037302 RepID=UPI0029E80EDB|nr:FAD-dependent monooxygenase [Lichenihabitans sp. Uapishka_5]MDX7953577.1 FAD-dependent monooxygenase [Lichenihabitans sp. Uapishka_5]